MDAILLGRDHPDLGVVEVRTPAPNLAIGISRGLHPKPYDHVDPNEDVVAVVADGGSTALVLADGHNGHQASHAAVEGLLEALGRPVPAGVDRRTAVQAFHAANEHLRDVRGRLSGPHRHARTTLLLAVVGDHADGTRSLVTCSVGDSAVLLVDDRSAVQVTRDRHRFMGDRLSVPEVAGTMDYATPVLSPEHVVVAVTDGFTNFVDPAQVPAVIDRADPGRTARRLIDLAGAGGAGDNVAVAVLVPRTGEGTR